MLAAQRVQVLQWRGVHSHPATLQSGGNPLQVDRIPENNGRSDQIQSTGAVALLLKAAASNFAKAVEESRKTIIRIADWHPESPNVRFFRFVI